MTSGKPGVMIYFDMMESVKYLSDKNAGILFKAIMHYARDAQQPKLPEKLLPLWAMVRSRVDSDDDAYQEKTTKNKYSAYVRWQRAHGSEPIAYEEWILAGMPSSKTGSELLS